MDEKTVTSSQVKDKSHEEDHQMQYQNIALDFTEEDVTKPRLISEYRFVGSY